MKIKISIQNKAAITLLITTLLLILAVSSYATGQTRNIGHYAENIWTEINGEEKNVQEVMEEKIEELSLKVMEGEIPASTGTYNIYPPEGYSIEQCTFMLAANDAHYGPAFDEEFYNNDQSNAWKESHYAGLQAFYSTFHETGSGTLVKGWKATCKYGFTDEEKSNDYRYDPEWEKAHCSYLIICKK